MNPRVLYRAATYATDARSTADSVISALTPAAWYRNATDVVESGGFASIWADYADSNKGLVLPGVAGNYASTPDATPLDITDDLEVIVRCMARDYTPSSDKQLVGKWGSGTESWKFYVIPTTGTLGIVLQGIAAYQSTVAPTCTDGVAYWFRVTRVRSTGKINFYQAADSATVPSSWTQVGTEVSGSTAAMLSTAAELLVGDFSAAFDGVIYRVIVKNGIDGTTVFDADFSAQTIGAGSFTESSSNAATVTINTSGASPAHIGKARDLLQGTATNQPAYSAGVFTFDGADNFMSVAYASTQPRTYYWVGKQVTWTNGDHIFNGVTANVALFQATGTPQLFLYSGSANAASNNNLAVNTAGIVCAVFNGASSSLRVNNTAKTTGSPGAANPGGLTLGAANGGAASWSNITALEFIDFAAAHDDATQSSVITALNNALTVF